MLLLFLETNCKFGANCGSSVCNDSVNNAVFSFSPKLRLKCFGCSLVVFTLFCFANVTGIWLLIGLERFIIHFFQLLLLSLQFPFIFNFTVLWTDEGTAKGDTSQGAKNKQPEGAMGKRKRKLPTKERLVWMIGLSFEKYWETAGPYVVSATWLNDYGMLKYLLLVFHCFFCFYLLFPTLFSEAPADFASRLVCL